MTPPDIDALAAGPELDALVAEKVMKWTHVTRVRGIPSGVMSVIGQRIKIPEYSTDIAAAWQVFVKISSRLYKGVGVLGLQRYKNKCAPLDCDSDYGWGVTSSEGPDWLIGWAETAPLAICRAALKAVMW